MSSIKEERSTTGDPAADSGDNSDPSLSESWTVLDSSHFDDGDLSDAESVEVLASAEQLIHENQSDADAGIERNVTHGSETASASANINSHNMSESTNVPSITEESDENAFEAPDGDDASEVLDEGDPTPDAVGFRFASLEMPEILNSDDWCILPGIHKIGIFSSYVNVFLFIYVGLLAIWGQCFFSNQYISSGDKMQRNLKTCLPVNFEMDPLSLYFSHVLAEWKKHPQEDHSLDRQVLKTLLLYYGGNTELAVNIRSLSEKVQKHRELLRDKEKELNHKEYQQMIASVYLAHSVAFILGNPGNLFFHLNDFRMKGNNFAPEPGFWLNEWNMPQYFKTNDTYYRIDTKPIPPPMQNLFVHLGSAKWNQYFWELYHDKSIGKKEEDDRDRTMADMKISDVELEGEETERSPLDSPPMSDLLSSEESSGRPDPLFASDLEKDPFENDKREPHGNYFEVEDGEDNFERDLDNPSGYECANGGCRRFKEHFLQDEGGNGEENPRRGKLIQLFEEFAEDESHNKNLLNMVNMVLSLDSENFREEHPQNLFEHLSRGEPKREKETHDSFEETLLKGKLSKLFEDFPHDKSMNDGVSDKSRLEIHQNTKMDEVQTFNTLSEDSEDDFLMYGSRDERKTKTKDRKQKNKAAKQNSEELSFKSKQKKKGKGKSNSVKADSESKKKIKKRNLRKHLKLDETRDWVTSDFLEYNDGEETFVGKMTGKIKFIEDHDPDWNTRMARGRERLRALQEKRDKQMWVFERAKARRDMREELLSQ